MIIGIGEYFIAMWFEFRAQTELVMIIRSFSGEVYTSSIFIISNGRGGGGEFHFLRTVIRRLLWNKWWVKEKKLLFRRMTIF